MKTNLSTEIEFSLHQGPRRRPGSEMDPGRLPRVTQVLALALSFQDMIATGKARNYEDLANRTGVTAERLSQVMKLVWLAPAIQEEILWLPACGARYPATEHAVRLIAVQWSWQEQLKLWSTLKETLCLENGLSNDSRPDECTVSDDSTLRGSERETRTITSLARLSPTLHSEKLRGL